VGKATSLEDFALGTVVSRFSSSVLRKGCFVCSPKVCSLSSPVSRQYCLRFCYGTMLVIAFIGCPITMRLSSPNHVYEFPDFWLIGSIWPSESKHRAFKGFGFKTTARIACPLFSCGRLVAEVCFMKRRTGNERDEDG
jgi:hypothetical protein